MCIRDRATRDTNSESQEQEFDINNQLSMEGSKIKNTMESEVNAIPSEEINQSREWGQESEPREMNFNMVIEFMKQMKEEQRQQSEETRRTMMKQENRMKKQENILTK